MVFVIYFCFVEYTYVDKCLLRFEFQIFFKFIIGLNFAFDVYYYVENFKISLCS